MSRLQPVRLSFRYSRAVALAVTGLSVLAQATRATDVFLKSTGTSDLSLSTNWVGNATPSATTVAAFNGALANTSLTLTDNLQSYAGIKVLQPSGDLTIGGVDNFLTLGTNGIDMSAATKALTLNNSLELIANQTFNTVTMLTVGGSTNLSDHTLTIAGAGITSFAGLIFGDIGTSNLIKSGSGTLTLSALAGVGSLTMASGVLLSDAQNIRNNVSFTGGTINLSGTSSGTITATMYFGGTATFLRAAPTIALTGAWYGNGTVNWLSTATDSTGSLTGMFANFTGTLAFGTSTGSLRLVGITDRNLGNAAVDLGSSTFTLFTREGAIESIGALSGGVGTILRGADQNALTTYVIGGANLSTTFDGAIVNGAGGGSALVKLTKTGTGTLTLTSTASTYSGSLTISNGVLATNQTASLGALASSITLGNAAAGTAGTLRWTGGSLTLARSVAIESTGVMDASNTVGRLTITGGTQEYGGGNNQPRTLVLSGSNTSVNLMDRSIANNGSGAVTLIKSGSNTWQLTRTNNAYSGGTVINLGTLVANGNASQQPLGVSDVTVNNGGVLAGAFSLGSALGGPNLTVHAGGTLRPGNDAAVGLIGAINSAVVNLDAGAVLSMQLQDAPRDADSVYIFDGGTLNLGASSAGNPILLDVFDASGDGTTAYAQNGTFALFTNIDVASTDGVGNLSHLFGAHYIGSSPASGTLTNFQVRNLAAPGFATFTIAAPGTSSSIILTIGGFGAAAPMWTGAGLPGDWSDGGNWSPHAPGSGEGAVFPASSPGGTISLNGLRSVNTLSLDTGTHSAFYLAPGVSGKLYLDNGGGTAAVTNAGNNVLAADVQLVSATTVTVSSGTLTVSGTLSSNGAALTINGPGRVVLSSNNAHTGSTVLNGVLQVGTGGATGSLGTGAITNNGQLIIKRSSVGSLANAISGGGTLTHAGSGTTTLTAAYSGTGPVQMDAGRLSFAATGAPRNTAGVVLAFQTLSIASGATLDVTNHDVIIGNTTLGAVEAMLLAGWGVGAPGAPALTSSTARQLTTTALIPLSADAYLGGGSAVGKTWDGVTITQPNSVLIRYTFSGDLNFDSVVNTADFNIAVAHLGQTTPVQSSFSAAWQMGDVTLDGVVNGLDLATMAGNAVATVNLTLADFDGTVHSVPEAGTLLLFMPTAVLLLRKRRYRR